MVLTTGPQLRAARAMAGFDRQQLAEASGITTFTIRRLEVMEGRLKATTKTVDALQRALEAAGVEFLDGEKPGVRMRAPSAA